MSAVAHSPRVLGTEERDAPGNRRLVSVLAPDPGEDRDNELLEGIIGGDAESFARLFERYSPIAMALARRILRQPHLAEETVQEAFLAVWCAPDGYRSQHGACGPG